MIWDKNRNEKKRNGKKRQKEKILKGKELMKRRVRDSTWDWRFITVGQINKEKEGEKKKNPFDKKDKKT